MNFLWLKKIITRDQTGYFTIGNCSVPVTKAQAQFLKCDAQYPVFIGGFGSGKTTAICLKAIQMATEKYPGRNGVIVAPSYLAARDSIIPTLCTLLTRLGFQYHASYHQNKLMLIDYDKASIRVHPVETFSILLGLNFAWAGIDDREYVSADDWKDIGSRIRHPGERQQPEIFSSTETACHEPEYYVGPMATQAHIYASNENKYYDRKPYLFAFICKLFKRHHWKEVKEFDGLHYRYFTCRRCGEVKHETKVKSDE